MESSYLFTCCENNIFLGIGLFDKLNEPCKILIYKNVLMKSAIKANDDFVVFKSNKITSTGISQLLLE